MSSIPQTLQKSVTGSETVHNGNLKTVQLPLFLSKKNSKLIKQFIDAIELNNLANLFCARQEHMPFRKTDKKARLIQLC